VRQASIGPVVDSANLLIASDLRYGSALDAGGSECNPHPQLAFHHPKWHASIWWRYSSRFLLRG